MSAPKFQSASYKLFEPDYHPQKPIIVGLDDRLESPETLTLRYEEAARAASGGDPRGDSPPRILDMAAYGKQAPPLPSMHGYESTRYQPASYDAYSTQAFPPSTEKFAQLNQQAFSSNNAVNAGVSPYMPAGPAVLSWQPQTGVYGTKVFLKFSAQYDLFGIASAIPYFYLQFGSEKCPMHDVTRDNQDTNGFVYSCSADAPQFLVTGSESNNVPLALLIEGAAGEEISRTAVGTFQYVPGSGDDITRPGKGSSDGAAGGPQTHESVSPKTEPPMSATGDASTNNYEDPSPQGPYPNATFPQGAPDMISTYRSSSFADPPYHRRSAHGWSGFAGTLASTGRSPILGQPGIAGRNALSSLPMPSSGSGTPQLVRTSTISNPGGSSHYHHVSLYSAKAVLKIQGRLETMTENWTPEEWSSRRRIVMFRRSQTGSTLTATFRSVAVNERPPNSICISCIYWAERDSYFVTSVDTIYLLEQLVAAPSRFSVEEKNRIRRNLEGFHPQTVSKVKADSEEFFKLIMGFPNPKPRNIEKDVKVFPWKTLEAALKKIIGKYSANPSTPAMMTPTPYTLPTPPGPGQSLSSQASDHHSQYSVHTSHHDAMPSPRSLSGSQPAWTPYTAAPAYTAAPSRTLSPNMRLPSPQHPPSLRVGASPLPAVTTYDTRTVTTAGYAPSGLHAPITHHHASTTPPRWDPSTPSYSDSYPSLPSHHTQGGHAVYTNATASYNDAGVPRA
ncbi:unnamed protein product [Clonostachys byssicola]|uniref:DUF7082 domain-containing protein n=1 Tax=Clonostachys byssicola TaxID=160290 RepID=A0A9N9U4C4_9HYPO|nr:unnamed protein product [Clonostachys byssicola]